MYPTAAVYCATKFAIRAISEGLRQESTDIRVTVISPGVTESELASTTTDAEAAQWLEEFRGAVISPDEIARAIAFAIEQSEDVDVNEIVVVRSDRILKCLSELRHWNECIGLGNRLPLLYYIASEEFLGIRIRSDLELMR